MSKLNDGKPIYNDKGKVMKGPNYFKPDLNKFVYDEKLSLIPRNSSRYSSLYGR